MALTLVPRHIRALSDHLNQIYRVLKGTDPDSLAVRLPASGSFQIRHSATAAPVLLVTDAGIDGSDIMAATIPSSALITGAAITPNSITNAEIADGTVRTQELADDAVTSAKILAGTIATTDLAANAVTNVSLTTGWTVTAANQPTFFLGSGTIPFVTTGGPVLIIFSCAMRNSVAGAAIGAGVQVDGSINIAGPQISQSTPADLTATLHVLSVQTLSAASHTFRPFGTLSSGVCNVDASGAGSLMLLEMKR